MQPLSLCASTTWIASMLYGPPVVRCESHGVEICYFLHRQVPRRSENTATMFRGPRRVPGSNIGPQKYASARARNGTKAFTPPTPAQTQQKAHHEYLARPDENEQLTFLEWLCYYDHKKNPAKRYEDRTTLVGVKHFSVFNPLFFYQLLIMHMPHRKLDQLRDPWEDHLLEPIKYFVPAREKLLEILGSKDAILQYLSSESNKRSYFETIVNYIQSVQDIYTLWHLGLIDNTFATSERSQFEIQYPLSPQQRAVYTTCAGTAACHLCDMDHCRYWRQQPTTRRQLPGLQEIPTSFRVPRNW